MDTTMESGPEDLPFTEPDWGEELLAADGEFADNPEPRCPCVLVLDTSSSMAGAPLAALQAGLRTFQDELLGDPLARQRVEVAVITFGGPVEVVQPFATADRFQLAPLQPRGQTPLGTGLLEALKLIEARKVDYRRHGITWARPWIFLITDGMPQGEPWEVTREAVRRVREAEAVGRALLFAVGVEGANLKFLAMLTPRPPLTLTGLRFAELFTWLSASTVRLAAAPTAGLAVLPPADCFTTANVPPA